MIPRKLHQIWVGPREVPQGWADAWRDKHPGWEYRLWREDDIAALPLANAAAYAYYRTQKNWVGMSDIARYSILAEHGGVYVDVDSKALRSFEGAPFMAHDFFAAYEPVASLPGRVANGCIGSAPGHHIWATLARLIADMPNIDQVWDSTGGTGLTAAILAHRQCCQPLVLPARTFYATNAAGAPSPGREDPYSTHFWASTNSVYPARAVILVPRRAGNPRRDRLWEFTQASWATMGLPIIEGHDEGDHPFSAALARNRAAVEAGDWEVAVFVDADTVMPDYGPVREGIALAHKTNDFVRPFRQYWMTDEAGADTYMERGTRPTGRPLRDSQIHGGVNIIPRGLWDRVGGYDERFRGWGYEDAAIEVVAKALGGFQQLRGEVYHLWHPISADRAGDSPTLKANRELFERYGRAAGRRSAMRSLLAERSGAEPAPLSVGAVVMTNGRRDMISRLIPSLEQQAGPFAARLICDDSGDPEYQAWLATEFPRWTVEATRGRIGHGPAVRFAMTRAAKLETDWVFWCEDDYEFPQRLDLGAMANVLMDEPHLKQMVVKRQPWFPSEVEAGGMIERFDPRLFKQRTGPDGPWVEHRQFFSLNPHLIERTLVAAISEKWPAVPNSEHHFSQRLFKDGRVKVGLWGSKADPPRAIHAGERVGTGY